MWNDKRVRQSLAEDIACVVIDLEEDGSQPDEATLVTEIQLVLDEYLGKSDVF